MDFELMHDLPHQGAVMRSLWMEVTKFEAASDRVDVSRADFGRFLKVCDLEHAAQAAGRAVAGDGGVPV